MKVFAIMKVIYDWHKFQELMGVGSDLEKLKSEFNDLPMFSSSEINDRKFKSPSGDGPSHYYYEEYDV